MNLNWSYSPETPNLGQIRQFLVPCDLEIWRMTLKNNRAPLLSNIKLYVSFHHMCVQTGVTVRKRLSWVVTSVTLTFDLRSWPYAWTLPWSYVITPEIFMMMRWWEHSQKGVTDRQTDRQWENTIHRAAWSQLRIWLRPKLDLKKRCVLKNGLSRALRSSCHSLMMKGSLIWEWQCILNSTVLPDIWA